MQIRLMVLSQQLPSQTFTILSERLKGLKSLKMRSLKFLQIFKSALSIVKFYNTQLRSIFEILKMLFNMLARWLTTLMRSSLAI